MNRNSLRSDPNRPHNTVAEVVAMAGDRMRRFEEERTTPTQPSPSAPRRRPQRIVRPKAQEEPSEELSIAGTTHHFYKPRTLGFAVIPWSKPLLEVTGRDYAASLLMAQLEYWFGIAAKPDGSMFKDGSFYHFITPAPESGWYAPGQSWQEELGLSEKMYRTRFDKIGVRHPSREAFFEAQQKGREFITADGKETYYACYQDPQQKWTRYFRNHCWLDYEFEPPQRTRKT